MSESKARAKLPATNLLMELIQGQWLLAFSSLPVWTKENRIRQWRYLEMTPPAVGPEACMRCTLDEVVHYEEILGDHSAKPVRTREHTYKGFSRQLKSTEPQFLWRSSGWMGYFSSVPWRVVHLDNEHGIFAACYEKSMLSQAGCQVFVRPDYDDTVSAGALSSALEVVKRQPEGRDLVGGLGTRWGEGGAFDYTPPVREEPLNK